ncbi:MAG: DUF790 family protein [Halolamina sp.]
MLRKEHLRVSRAGGGYAPEFVGSEATDLAARVVGVFQGHVGRSRGELQAALTELEQTVDRFKLVRGLAALCEREAEFEVRAPIPPERARRIAFEAGTTVGVADEADRREALTLAADRLGVTAETVEESLYADRDVAEVLAAFEPRWNPSELVTQYNLSLAQTALFDAVEVRVRCAEPARLVSAVKRLGLMYEVRETDDGGRELVVTGPDSLFRASRRYGTAFARLLRTVAETAEWRLRATVDDRGRERELTLTETDVSVPGVAPLSEPSYDSGVESSFAARFAGLDLDWRLVREPEPLAAGHRVMVPDFAFEYAPGGADEVAQTVAPDASFRVYFEIMGFWTPEYVEKKLDQLRTVEDVTMLVAVDDSLGVGERVAATDSRVLTYDDAVRVKDVVDALGEFERDLVADAAAELPAALAPADDVVALATVAERHGVAVDAVEEKSFPDHELVGRTLVRPAVLSAVDDAVETGMSLSEAESVLGDHGLDDASAVLSALGYRVEWDGLAGGTVRAT